jgi:O-antigen/teichoic acid export membrane protein
LPSDSSVASHTVDRPGASDDPARRRYAGRVDGPRGALRQLAARGTIVNALFLVSLNTLGLLKGFAVAAFLTAPQYGVWGLLVIAFGTLGKLKQVGIGDKFIQQDEVDQEVAFQKAFTLEVVMNAALLALLLAVIPLYALITGQPQIVAPGLVLAAAVPAVALQSPTWVFYRRMNFVRQRSLEAIEPVVSFVVTIPLAIAGFSYWSLVIGLFVGRWIGGLVAAKAAPYRLRLRLERGTTREYLSFSWPLFASGALTLLIPQISILVGEWKLGLAGAGMIALAGSIVVYTDRVDSIVTQALYPAICAVRDRTALLYESFVKSNRLALMWGVPFGVGITLFAPDLVAFGLGERWRPAIALMQVWGLVAAANHIGFNWHAFYRAKGNTRPTLVVTAIAVVTLAVSIVPLIDWRGVEGFGLAVGLMAASNLVARGYYMARLFPGFKMVGHALRAIAPTVPAVAATLAVRALFGGDRTPGIAVSELVVYLAVTAAATLLFERALLREALGYVRARPRLA